jgi:ABC-type sugar transport system ATPase subunit
MAGDPPEVIILDEPTKGIDIGSKAAVHQFMSELVSQGLAVIMVSSELPEVMGMADRIIVMHEGLMVAEYRAGKRRRKPSSAPPAARSGGSIMGHNCLNTAKRCWRWSSF